ncbi:amino acid permease [Staphylococcus aureus]
MMGIFTGLNGFLMSSSRLLFSMGRSGIMPTMFSKLHSKYKTPYVAIIFLVGVSLIAPWLGRTALTWIVVCHLQVYPLPTLLHVCLQRNYSVITNKVIRMHRFTKRLLLSAHLYHSFS